MRVNYSTTKQPTLTTLIPPTPALKIYHLRYTSIPHYENSLFKTHFSLIPQTE